MGLLTGALPTGALLVIGLLACARPIAADPGPTHAPAFTASAPSEAADAQEADSLRAFLVTFGPGSAVWERFGHNALWIHDPATGTDRAYHYGLFDMTEEGFLLHFLQGRMWYSMGDAPAEWMVDVYRRAGRAATVQELALTRPEIREMQAFLEWNVEPENRVYRYDYFRDNCSTRIRDALDRVLEGRLRATLSNRPSPVSYREQAVALTAEDRLLTTGMDLGLGPLADQPITRWDLAFIPMRLRDDLRDLTVDRNGAATPLVASERTFPATGAADERFAEPPLETSQARRAFWHLLVGLGIGALFAAAGYVGRRRAVSRWALGIGGGTWGLVTGGLGLILLALWTLTDHEFAWHNENLLQTNPVALALVVLAPLASLGGRNERAAVLVALILAGLSVLGLVLHPLPITPQSNLAIIALTLPVHLGLAWALWRLRGLSPSRESAGRAARE